MRDYSIDKDEAKEFILNYLIMGDKLLVYYANGNVEDIDYSVQAEKEVLERMKAQVLNSKRFSENLNFKFDVFFKLLVNEIMLLILFAVTAFNINMTVIPAVLSIIVFATIIGLTVYKMVDYQNLRNDIRKNNLFLDNEDNLNPVIRYTPEVIRGLDERLKAKVLDSDSDNFSFTFNTVGRMEYKELDQVYKHVEDVISEDKPKVLRKVKK